LSLRRVARTIPDRGRARQRAAACALAAVALAACALPAGAADLASLVNSMRRQGCAGGSTGSAPVQADKKLDTVARELARGGKLRDAIEVVAYPAQSSASVHVKGAPDDDTIRRELAKQHCRQVTDPRFTELGSLKRGNEVWIVLAVRRVERPPLEAGVTAARVLELVNEARSTPRRCGRKDYAAAPPVTLSARLSNVALLHAQDMALHQTLGHRGSDGSEPAERVTRAGYEWRGTGENVAAGQDDADAVVAAWLQSPGHCLNIMEPGFTEMGVAFSLAAPGSNPETYWAQVFATPH
jgi:uncharacterized protein YkwD